ncbi:hypothetical protein AB6C51_17975 [Vibrio splendidus]
MNKPMVLVIHGMGTHKPGETKVEISSALNEAAKNFGIQDFDINNEVEFFQFNYSDFLDDIRLKDAEKASSIVKHISLLKGHGLGERAAAELSQHFAQYDSDKMFYTHWLDVIYYGLTYWGEKIRVDLAKKINDLMRERELQNRTLHIVAHSLGSAVLHDTLVKVFRKDTDLISNVPQLDVDRFQIDTIWMVANVSRLLNLLNDIADPNFSVVTSDTGGCTKSLFNVQNTLDPFTWFQEYTRPITQGGRHIKVETIRKVNTHDLREYMASPNVAETFFANVLRHSLKDQQYQNGKTTHHQTSLNYNIEEIEQACKSWKTHADTSDKIEALKELSKAVEGFYKELKQKIDSASDSMEGH